MFSRRLLDTNFYIFRLIFNVTSHCCLLLLLFDLDTQKTRMNEGEKKKLATAVQRLSVSWPHYGGVFALLFIFDRFTETVGACFDDRDLHGVVFYPDVISIDFSLHATQERGRGRLLHLAICKLMSLSCIYTLIYIPTRIPPY